jgi:hypothetical protein
MRQIDQPSRIPLTYRTRAIHTFAVLYYLTILTFAVDYHYKDQPSQLRRLSYVPGAHTLFSVDLGSLVATLLTTLLFLYPLQSVRLNSFNPILSPSLMLSHDCSHYLQLLFATLLTTFTTLALYFITLLQLF